jgi:hypothetical protein
MRAELSAALCSPKDNQFGLKVDPTKLDLALEGTPEIEIPPFAIDLPTVTITPPTVTVTTPAIVATAGVTISTNPFAPGFTVAVTITPLTLTVAATPLTIALGSVKAHGVPETATDLPIKAGLDLDKTKATSAFDGLHAALEGCLTLNGGEPFNPPPPPPPPPTVAKAEARTVEGKTLLAITGQGFGASQGQGSVEVTDVTNTKWVPSAYQTWTDQLIEVLFQPPLPPGSYAAAVTNNSGGKSGPILFTV